MADSTDSGLSSTVPDGTQLTSTSIPVNPSSKAASVEDAAQKLAGMSLDDRQFRYKMGHKRRGQFIIINNENFLPKTGQHEKPRKGTDVDAANLFRVFKRVGFEVTIKKDKTTAEMFQIVLDAAKSDHSDCDCFGLAVLSHGDKDIVYGIDDVIEIDKLLEPIKTCKSLFGKPKIIMIQACRGNKCDPGTKDEHDGSDDEMDSDEVKKKALRIPLEADFIYAYSTVPNYFAWRNSAEGSWFVQAFHKVFDQYHDKLDFARLLTRVNYGVAYGFESSVPWDPSKDHMKQVPSVVSMLTKDLYFYEK